MTEAAHPERDATVERLQRRLDRERLARAEAEVLAEQGMRALYEKQAQLQLLQGIAAAANQATRSREPLLAALAQICAFTGWPVSHAYLARTKWGELEATDLWHLATPECCTALQELTRQLPVKLGRDLAGRIIVSGQPERVDAASSAVDFPRAAAAAAAGLVGGYAFPVSLGGEIVAVLEFFSTQPFSVAEPIFEVVGNIAETLARVIERERAEAELELARADLELRVKQRTLELARTVEELQVGLAERRRAELELLLRDRAIAATSNGIVLCDASRPDQPIVYCNPAFERITGYAAAEARGCNCRFLQGPDTDPAALAVVRQALRDHTDCQVVLKNYRKDGQPFWIELAISPVRDAAGHLTHFVGIQADITERRRAEEAELRKQDKAARHQQVVMDLSRLDKADLTQSLQTLLRRDAQTMGVERVSYWSFQAEDSAIVCEHLYAQSRDEFPPGQLRLEARQFPAYFAALQESNPILADDAQADPRTREFTESYLRPLGITAMLDVPVWLGGKMAGVLCHEHIGAPRSWDHLDRELALSVSDMISLTLEAAVSQRAGAALRQAQARLEDAIEILDAGFAIFDPDERLVTWNEQYEQLYPEIAAVLQPGIRLGELLHQFCRAGGHQHSGLDAPQWIARRRDQLRAATGAEDQRLRDRWIRVSNRRTSDGGVVSLSTDITELKESEQVLRTAKAATDAANAELAKAARLKDEFLASMSHELRTPLNAILGLSEALQEQVYGALNEKQQRSLRSIEESGRHLLALINDILDLSKIEAGAVTLELEPVELEPVCQASLRFVKELAQKKHLQLSLACAGPVTHCRADERRLKQMLVNLLTNAVKFTPDGGAVGLEVTVQPEQDTACFTVWDTGIGIAPEDMPKLFQSFVQIDSKLSRQYEGTGLGLVLVRRMAELHGGSVSLVSEPGKGSRFTLRLPLGAVEPAPPPAVHAPRSETTHMKRALVIEGSAEAAEQLCRYLHELDMIATVHPSGEGAVAKAAELQPGVILLEILLPQCSGWEVAAQLRDDPRTRAIPVIIITVVDDRSRGLALGAAEYLVKPVSRPQVHAALAKAGLQAADLPSPPLVSAAPAAPLVLLAEDNEANITTIADYLTANGCRMVVARDGLEALEQARQISPDLILMDIQMPRMDGLEATRRLRAEPRFATTPIFALTALAMTGDRERCLAAGADEYLAKPVSLRQLLAAIRARLTPPSA